MKKLFIMMAALFAGVSMSAQMKGDMSISGNFGIGTGNSVATTNYSNVTTTVKAPKGIDFNIGASYGYFVADNLEVSLGLYYGLYRIQNNWMDTDTNKKFYDMKNSFTIAPQLKYYLSIVDDVFYYTPSFKIGYSFESGKSQLDENTTVDYKWELEGLPGVGFGGPRTFTIGLDLVSFEYKPSYNIGINFSLGGIYYKNVSYKYEADDSKDTAKVSDNSFSLGFDTTVRKDDKDDKDDRTFLTPTIGVKFYFF